MNRTISLLGLLGVVFLAFTLISWQLSAGGGLFPDLFVIVNAMLAGLCLVLYIMQGGEHLRNMIGERSTKYGANVIVSSVLFLLIVIGINYIVAQRPQRFDLTEQNVYSLSPQSISVVENLEKPLTIQAFVAGGQNPELEDLLGTYRDYSDQVSFQLLDPYQHRDIAQRYQIQAYNTLRLEYGEAVTTTTQPTEEGITNAIVKVTRATSRVVCFIKGHGEPSIDNAQDPNGFTSFRNALENESYAVEEVLLMTVADVPEQCTLLVVASAKRPYIESEIEAIGRYLDGGGRAVFFLNPQMGNEFKPLLAQWHVSVEDAVIIDPVLRLFQGPTLGVEPVVNTFAAHEITRSLQQQGAQVVFPLTRPIRAATDTPAGVQAMELAKTSDAGWAESDVMTVFSQGAAELDPSTDIKGPVPVAAAVKVRKPTETNDADEKDASASETRIVAFGSIAFAQNRDVEASVFNKDLLLNSAGWLTGQAELIAVRSGSLRASRTQLTADQSRVIFYFSVLLLPELLLLAGLTVWWRRE